MEKKTSPLFSEFPLYPYYDCTRLTFQLSYKFFTMVTWRGQGVSKSEKIKCFLKCTLFSHLSKDETLYAAHTLRQNRLFQLHAGNSSVLAARNHYTMWLNASLMTKKIATTSPTPPLPSLPLSWMASEPKGESQCSYEVASSWCHRLTLVSRPIITREPV